MRGSDGSSSLGTERFFSQLLSSDVGSQFSLDFAGLDLASKFDLLSLKFDLLVSPCLLELQLGTCKLILDLSNF